MHRWSFVVSRFGCQPFLPPAVIFLLTHQPEKGTHGQLGCCKALGSGLPEPDKSFFIGWIHAFSIGVHDSQIILCQEVSFCCPGPDFFSLPDEHPDGFAQAGQVFQCAKGRSHRIPGPGSRRSVRPGQSLIQEEGSISSIQVQSQKKKSPAAAIPGFRLDLRISLPSWKIQKQLIQFTSFFPQLFLCICPHYFFPCFALHSLNLLRCPALCRPTALHLKSRTLCGIFPPVSGPFPSLPAAGSGPYCSAGPPFSRQWRRDSRFL